MPETKGAHDTADRSSHQLTRKFRRERAVGRYLANPIVKGLARIGLRTSLSTELETIGRKTGKTRVVPVAAKFDGTGAWVICQHGTRSGWGANIISNPQVGIRHGKRWRSGEAAFHLDDDVVARARSFAPSPALGALSAYIMRALQTDPVSVRITFTDIDQSSS